MSITALHLFVILPVFAATFFAGPAIKFNTKEFHCGTVIEGKTSKITAIFPVKNTGDSLLKLEKVLPGCGCTKVEYDSLVLPGKKVKIEAEVDITGSRSGLLSKSITVISNATNEPRAKLSIDAILLPIIEVSERHLSLDSSNINSPATIMLATKKPDFKVSGISFRYGDYSGAAGSEPPPPLSIRYTFIPTDSINSDGYHAFRLNVYSPGPPEFISGKFAITTNHPEKPEILLRGNIAK